MKRKASITVVFSVVFVLLLSFILSFFEMAAYTARSAYHASAALLAVENYFAGYLSPLYEQYHIFGREVPEGKDILSWTESAIAKDVLYMTQKREGEKSLLLRSGAAFSADSAKVLTEKGLDGFYLQAVSAMKYRSVLEVSDMLKQFAGIAEQADTQLEVAVAKNAADTAYSLVEEKLLQLIEQVDGVSLPQYEKFLRGKTTAFQTEVYVKYFCTDPQTAARYFDRTEVYQAFLKHSENPCAVLEGLAERTKNLLPLVKEREENEEACQRRLKEIAAEGAVAAQALEQLYDDRDAAKMQFLSVQAQIVNVTAAHEEEENLRLEALLAEEARISGEIERMEEEKEALQKLQESLLSEKQEQENRLGELNRQKREQDKQVKALSQEEDRFLKKCAGVAKKCEEADRQTGEIRQELEAAKKVKADCEKLLDSVQVVIGEEAAGEYRKELEKYKLYESAEGYDFEQMKVTLKHNAELLYHTGKCLSSTDAASLGAALTGLQKEAEALSGYSFEGLKLNYGEKSLDEDLSGQAKDILVSAAGKGFLGFLTEKEVSEKKLEVSYLPSGFRYEGNASGNVFSTLGTNVNAMLCELREMLPSGGTGGMLETAVNAVLFHSYLMTHFSDYLEENRDGALSYELEYLIAGKAGDRDNLFSVAMQICVLRTALHFISLYTDGACKSAAEQAALAACGIIGLPALTSVITFVLLFVWAAEEAIIDVAALLQGKKLALYPGRNAGSLTFPEIFLFSQKLVLGKAKEKKEAGGLAFGYREYLQVYLLLLSKETKCYRALDLIQENLRKDYRDSFRVNRCVWQLSYQVDHRKYEYSYND